MSKFFKALEQAERDGAEQVPQAPVEAVSQRPSVMTRWPEPAKEEPPRAPSPVDEPTTPPAESPRPVFEPPRPVFKSPRPVVQSPRVASALLDEHLVSLQAPSTAAAEPYRAVTSPGVGDGKSVTAINLAGALAQSPDARVLLADMDLRRPAVARYLALGEGRPSLAEALGTPGIALKDAVVQVPSFNLSVLRAPASVAAPYELLRSPRLEALLAEARQEYDYVVIDTPPFVPVPDCRVIAKSVDGFVVVVASNRTQRGLLAETLKTMDPDKAVGFVFNAHPTLPTPYYDYGNGHGKTSSWRRMGGTS
jgi:capsular exopolysaccharide synthesis family protein